MKISSKARGYLGLVVLGIAATLPFWLIQSNFVLSVVTLTFIFMLASVGWNIISGFGGQISFGHSIFFGFGAYTTAILQSNIELNAWLGLLCGGLLATVVAALIGALTLRLRDIYFTLSTFALTLTFAILANHYGSLTGGAVGLTLPFGGTRPANFQFGNKLWYYYVALGFVVLGFLVAKAVLRSRLGLQLRAIKDDEDAARASGVASFRIKLATLCISAFVTAVSGAVYMQYVGFIDPESAFGATVATQIAILGLVGGAGTLWGPILGAAILVPLQQLLNSSLSNLPSGVNLIVYAVVFIVILWVDPRGLVSILRRVYRQWGRRSLVGRGPDQVAESAANKRTAALSITGGAMGGGELHDGDDESTPRGR